ncbi:uncharacterized protein LOC134178237 isoform X2 [Corticium candelabrum]|uniref:uncharacterized protein LOC134178237 isoform X2 n=1 Tax=Corticium candelabrum TaxID=121492 RepID=UPI002E25CCF8|nr:uncharacterized protein LOC134178237 isoform X2 [Corticium candelabrum]
MYVCDVHVQCIYLAEKQFVYCVCCRSYKPTVRDSTTSEQRRDTKSKRMERPCLARMNVSIETEETVKVWYVSGHTGHNPGVKESHFLHLPASCKDKMIQKLIMEVTIERVLEGYKLEDDNCPTSQRLLSAKELLSTAAETQKQLKHLKSKQAEEAAGRYSGIRKNSKNVVVSFCLLDRVGKKP